jgi:hypothetical protein
LYFFSRHLSQAWAARGRLSLRELGALISSALDCGAAPLSGIFGLNAGLSPLSIIKVEREGNSSMTLCRKPDGLATKSSNSRRLICGDGDAKGGEGRVWLEGGHSPPATPKYHDAPNKHR